MKLCLLAGVLVSVSFFSGIESAKASILVGDFSGASSNAFPFTTSLTTGTYRFQQVYNADLFQGPTTIETISYFTGASTTAIAARTYTFRLSTTSKTVDGLSTTDFDGNLGSDLQSFHVFTSTGGIVSGKVTFDGTDFDYDPNNGNLLIDIVIDAPSFSGGIGGFYNRSGDFLPDSSRAHNLGGGFVGFGLVTEFDVSSANIPEPATMAIWSLIGISAIGVYCRRSRRKSGAMIP